MCIYGIKTKFMILLIKINQLIYFFCIDELGICFLYIKIKVKNLMACLLNKNKWICNFIVGK